MIEIDYNGALPCNIELMDEPGKMVNFNDADTKVRPMPSAHF